MAQASVERLLGGAARIRWKEELEGRAIEVLAVAFEGERGGREAQLIDAVSEGGEILFGWKAGKIEPCRLSWEQVDRLQALALELDRIAP